MSHTLEDILHEAQALSPEERKRLVELLTVNIDREAAARALLGKYAHVATSSADFAARKAIE